MFSDLYHLAQENPQYRQLFLDQLPRDPIVISGIIYHPLDPEEEFSMECLQFLDEKDRPTKNVILVYPTAFNQYNFSEFMCALQDHEYLHANQTQEDIIKRELEAYLNQLSRIRSGERKVSPSYKTSIVTIINELLKEYVENK